MRCFRATIEYDGTDFSGFQLQLAQRSVQGDLEKAIEKLTRQTVRVNGAGRTDAGVHALGQVISFRVYTGIPTDKMAVAMNSVLPPDISVVNADETDEQFHARFSARSRKYAYLILNRPQRSAVFNRYCWHVPVLLDLRAMRDGARMLLGERDFAAWANDVSEVRTTVRVVKRCAVKETGGFIVVSVEANAFLKGMVRNIVGTLMDVGRGKRSASEVDEITRSLKRENAGPSAPARGLCLTRVKY